MSHDKVILGITRGNFESIVSTSVNVRFWHKADIKLNLVNRAEINLIAIIN